jgi:mannitol-1-phosphate/altronate dehydrogenase
LVGQSTPDARVGALLSMAAIFPPGLSANAGFRETLSNSLDSLDRHGALATIERFVRS